MIVINPIDVISTGALIGSNIAANDHPIYSATTNYQTGDLVTFDNVNYEAIAASTGASVSDVTKWLNLGATNRAAAFDKKVGTKSKRANEITYQIQSSQLLSCIAFLDVTAVSISVTMTDPVLGIVYSKTKQLSDSGVPDWHEFFFDEYQVETDLILPDLPAYAGATIDVSITHQDEVQVGVILLGYQRELGETEWGINVGITDYSRKSRDDFGNVSILQRDYSDTMKVSLKIPTAEVGRVKKILAGLRAEPALYIASLLYDSTYVYGFYEGFNTVISGPIYADCSLDLEGLI